MDGLQLRDFVVRPTLQALGLHSEAAERLVMGTAAHESLGFRFIDQTTPGPGPARSLWQIELATYHDLMARSLPRMPAGVRDGFARLFGHPGGTIYPPGDRLWWDLALGAAVCRLLYFRHPDPLPAADDIPGLGAAWKKIYNTEQGMGTVTAWVANFRRHCGWYQ